MKGKYKIVVQNQRLHYEFEIKRNITIIQGDSATGKTTLVDMIRQAANLGASSGVEVVSDAPCRTLEGQDWKLILQNLRGNILFIDEQNEFLHTVEFAAAVRGSDNYFVLVTRENLYDLPYSVEEIYGLKSSGKYQNTKKIYQQMYHIYSNVSALPLKPDKFITEDSNAGYEFFREVAGEKGVDCESAHGKSNIFAMLKNPQRQKLCVVADGAAIGPEMGRLYKQVQKDDNIILYFPESFEWLVLKSGVVDGKKVQNILEHPEDFIDSAEYFSWERYFTNLLVECTENTYFKYSKAKLNPVYLHEKNKKAVLEQIYGIEI